MAIQHDRLLSIIEFAQQSARLSAKPAATVAQHGDFGLFEEDAQGRPGLHFNQVEKGSEREIWLAVERLHESSPPACQNELVKPWLDLPRGPEGTLSLKASVPSAEILQAEKRAAENADAANASSSPGEPSSVILKDYPRKQEVVAAFQVYMESRWKPWAAEEKKRRETIRLYAKLFTLRQQLEGGLVEAPSELVWGVGVGVWDCNGNRHAVVRQALKSETAMFRSTI